MAVNTVTNRLYTTHGFTGNVVVIDANDNTVITTIPTTGRGLMLGIDVNPTTNRVYTSSGAVIDAETNTEITTIRGLRGLGAFDVAVNPKTGLVYATVGGHEIRYGIHMGQLLRPLRRASRPVR